MAAMSAQTMAAGAAMDSNPLIDPDAYYRDVRVAASLKDVAASGGRITRVRWLMERGRADLSYVHGVLGDGTPVFVQGAACFLIPRWEMKKSLVQWAQSEGVYAKGLGLLDDANWSVLS